MKDAVFGARERALPQPRPKFRMDDMKPAIGFRSAWRPCRGRFAATAQQVVGQTTGRAGPLEEVVVTGISRQSCQRARREAHADRRRGRDQGRRRRQVSGRESRRIVAASAGRGGRSRRRRRPKHFRARSGARLHARTFERAGGADHVEWIRRHQSLARLRLQCVRVRTVQQPDGAQDAVRRNGGGLAWAPRWICRPAGRSTRWARSSRSRPR